MPNEYFDSALTGEQIEQALTAVHGLISPSNNGKVLCVENGTLTARSAADLSDITLEPLSVTANGDYTPSGNVDGYSSVHVAVPGSVLTTKSITQNGTYNASQDDADGYSSVVVNVSGGGGGAVVQPLSITQNGTYNPPSGVDGYAPVTVNVQGGGPVVSDNDILFHFNSDFRNSGSFPAVFVNVTGLEISNEQSKFGGHCLKCGTTQIYNNVALEYDFAFGDDDFTLDFWMYPTNLPESGSTTETPISFTYRSFAFYIHQTQLNVNFAYTNSSWGPTLVGTGIQLSNNEWHHVAVVRNGEELFLFLDGIKKATTSITESIAPITTMTVGSNTYNSGNRRFSGYIDELRIKLGQAVWTDDFTPPTEPYT